MTRIFHVSDLHFGRPAVPAQIEAIESFIQREKFDVVAISGDVSQRARAHMLASPFGTIHGTTYAQRSGSRVLLIFGDQANAPANLQPLLQALLHDVAIFADLDQAIKIKPDFARAYADRGLAYLAEGKDAEAEQDFKKCFGLDATLRPAIEKLANELRRRRAVK